MNSQPRTKSPLALYRDQVLEPVSQRITAWFTSPVFRLYCVFQKLDHDHCHGNRTSPTRWAPVLSMIPAMQSVDLSQDAGTWDVLEQPVPNARRTAIMGKVKARMFFMGNHSLGYFMVFANPWYVLERIPANRKVCAAWLPAGTSVWERES